MNRRTVVRRELEIDGGSEPLEGRLLLEGQPVRGFRGWLELFAAVEELRAGVKPDGLPIKEESNAVQAGDSFGV